MRSLAQILAELQTAEARVNVLTAEALAALQAQHAALFGDDVPTAPTVPAISPRPEIPPVPPALPPARPPRPVPRSAVTNVQALVAAGAAFPGPRADDGRLVLTQYGGPTDRTPDSGTEAGLGNRGNRLTAMSVALSPDLIHTLGLKGGEAISVLTGGTTYPLGTYDDSTATRIANTVDIYDPTDALGRDTFMVIIPAGVWRLLVNGAEPAVYTGSVPQKIRLAALALPNPFPYLPDTEDGNLGCADVVSYALVKAGVLDKIYLAVAELVARLKTLGWTVVNAPYADGDVVRWDKRPGGTHEHIGILIVENGIVIAVQNSSSLRKVDRVPLVGYDRAIIEVLRAPEGK